MKFQNWQELGGKEIEKERKKTVRGGGRREGSREKIKGERFKSYHS